MAAGEFLWLQEAGTTLPVAMSELLDTVASVVPKL